MAVAVVLFFTSCKTAPKIDWASRVGVFTSDDSVVELGPPDKMTQISTGRVAEWVTGGERGPVFSFGVGSYGGRGGVGVGTGTGGKITENLLRLTFDERDKLVTWESVKR